MNDTVDKKIVKNIENMHIREKNMKKKYTYKTPKLIFINTRN